MMLFVFYSLCLILSVSSSQAGFFSRRNDTRRMYYNSVRQGSKEENSKSPESFISLENTGQLEATLNDLIAAANFGDEVATAGEVPVIKSGEESKIKRNKESVIKPSEESVITAGEEYVEENVIKINNKKLGTSGVARDTGGTHLGPLLGAAPLELLQNYSGLRPSSKKEDDGGVNNQKRSKLEGRRRRKRRRKNRKYFKRKPGYNANEKRTALLKVADKRHSGDIEQVNEKVLEEKSQTKEKSGNIEKTEAAEESPEENLFNWQKPSGQWHLPTGQFHPISSQAGFDRRKMRRNSLFRSARLKYMVYTGELDSKIEANEN